MRTVNKRTGCLVLIGVAVGIVATVLAALLVVLSGAAGDGHFVFARLFFPFTMLLTLITDDKITAPLLILALAQFPLYGALGAVAYIKPHAALLLLVLIAAHIVAVVICFSGTIPNFS